MTNSQIISTECGLRNITEAVHTFAVWKSLGYRVRAGEKALFSTRLWKYTVNRKEDKKTGEIEESNNMYLTKAYLFGESQVDKVDKEVRQ